MADILQFIENENISKSHYGSSLESFRGDAKFHYSLPFYEILHYERIYHYNRRNYVNPHI